MNHCALWSSPLYLWVLDVPLVAGTATGLQTDSVDACGVAVRHAHTLGVLGKTEALATAAGVWCGAVAVHAALFAAGHAAAAPLVLGVGLVAWQAAAGAGGRALGVDAAIGAQRLADIWVCAGACVSGVAGAVVRPRAVRVQTPALAGGHAAPEHVLDEALVACAHARSRAVAADAATLAVRRAQPAVRAVDFPEALVAAALPSRTHLQGSQRSAHAHCHGTQLI